MRRDGLSEERIDEILANKPKPKQAYCNVWPENIRAYQLFTECSPQWERAGMEGQIVGINGSFYMKWVELFETKRRRIRRFYRDIELIAHGAIQAFDEQRKKNRK